MTWVRSQYGMRLDELLAELAFHERVGGDHPHEPGRPAQGGVGGHGRGRRTLGERHAERVGALQVRIPLPVLAVQGLVPSDDVRRVAHHRADSAGRTASQVVGVFGMG